MRGGDTDRIRGREECRGHVVVVRKVRRGTVGSGTNVVAARWKNAVVVVNDDDNVMILIMMMMKMKRLRTGIASVQQHTVDVRTTTMGNNEGLRGVITGMGISSI